MSLNLITGYSGTSHITSASDGCTNAGLYGKGKYVLNIAEKFGAEIISNNLIRIKSGYAINQGRKIELAINDYEEVEIDNGLQGVKRCDLIVIHYEKNLTTGIETGSVKVIKGTSGDIYSNPTYTSGDIINGANEDDFLLYRVKINGLSIEAVEPLFTVTESLMTLLDNMQENSKKLMGEADISKIGDGTVKGAIGALADSDKKINQSFAQVALVNRGVLPTGADVNRLNRNDAKALTENSIYELNGTNTYSNLPAGVKWGFIEVVKCSGFVLERVITNNDLFMRILANSAWSNWWGYFTSAEIEAKHQTSVKMVTVSDLPVNKNTFQQTYKAHGLNVNKITSVESFVDGDSHCHVTKCWVDGSLLRWNVSNESDSVAVVTVGAYVRYLK